MPTKDDSTIGDFVAIVDGKVVTIGNVTEMSFERETEDQEPVICLTDGWTTTATLNLTRDDRKVWAKILMLPKYKATEFIFPKKKKRGTVRRLRRMCRIIKKIIERWEEEDTQWTS